jgi:hypothetical protein
MKYQDLSRLLSQDTMSKSWIGEVVDSEDPEVQLRCKIKVFGLFDELETDDIPWAFPANQGIFASTTGGFGSGSVPKVGSLMKVKFSNGDIYAPEYYAIQNINAALQTEIEGDYQGTHVLAYDEDEDFKILYQPGTGIKIHMKESHITINPDESISIEHSGSESIIELVGSTCNIVTKNKVEITADSEIVATAPECTLNGTQTTTLGPTGNFSAVGSEPLWAFLKTMASVVDTKWWSTPGLMTGLAAAAETASTSKNNKVSVP